MRCVVLLQDAEAAGEAEAAEEDAEAAGSVEPGFCTAFGSWSVGVVIGKWGGVLRRSGLGIVLYLLVDTRSGGHRRGCLLGGHGDGEVAFWCQDFLWSWKKWKTVLSLLFN